MIVSRQKKLDDIIKKIKGPVFIFGCGICSVTSRTGGPKEVEAMKEILENKDIAVEGTYVIDAMCHLQKVRKAVRDNKEGLAKAGTVLVLSCGSGVQSAV
ncbi:MAG: methylenetetrahydrofolate reductase C-terminal domain-containing protein, partial [bacterium]